MILIKYDMLTLYVQMNKDVIASVPPHWKEGIDPEDEGSRFSGAVMLCIEYCQHCANVLPQIYCKALSTDSRITERAPPRIVNGALIADTPKKLYFPLERYPIDSEPEL